MTAPLLVTGAHRSGTTWVGKMLAASGQFTYVSEPLNIWHRPGVLRAPVKHWYSYLCQDNEADYLDAYHDTLRLRYYPWAELKSLRSLKDLGRMARDWSSFSLGRLRGRSALLKDPFAVFSAPWLAERLNCRVVVVVRHPAAFVSSLKRLGWTFNFRHLLDQPLLLRDWLEPYRPQMEAANEAPEDLIQRASLLWSLIYRVVQQYSQAHPGFQVVRHEDLSRAPLQGFADLYAALELPFGETARAAVHRSSQAGNPSEVSTRAIYSVNLDSRANLENWKQRLSADQIARIRALTAEVASFYYTDEDWEFEN